MIFGYIKSQTLELHYDKIVAESVDYLTAEFNFFTNEWEGFTKWAHFKKADQVFDILLEDNKINKNAHLNLSAGEWEVYLHGNSDTGERITTNVVVIKVEPTGILNGETLPEIPLSVAEQIGALAENAMRVAQSVRDDADNGVFDGEQGDDYILTESDKQEIADKTSEIVREDLKTKADLVDGKVPESQLPKMATDWESLEGKPFYEEKPFEDIVWNGSTEGLSVVQGEVDVGEGMIVTFAMCRVSELVLIKESVINANVKTIENSYVVAESDIQNESEAGSFTIFLEESPLVVVTSEKGYVVHIENVNIDLVFPEEGIWFILAKMGDEVMIQTKSLTSSGVVKQLDSKFINIEEVAEKAVEMIDTSFLSAIGSGVLE